MAIPDPVFPRRWRLRVVEGRGGWTPAGIAFYPLWRAEALTGPLAVRPDGMGMLEVNVPAAKSLEIDLTYREGRWERLGIVLSALALILWGGTAWIMTRR